jgi:hypothetical protein
MTRHLAKNLKVLRFAVQALDERVPVHEALLRIDDGLDVIYLYFLLRKLTPTPRAAVVLGQSP